MDIVTFYLTSIGVLLFIGLLFSLLSQKIKVANIIFLIFVGILFNHISYDGKPLIQFPPVFLTAMAIFTLIMIIFDSSSNFKFRDIDKFSLNAFKLVGVFLMLNLVFLTVASVIIGDVGNIFVGLIFATLMTATAPDAIMVFFENSKNKIVKLMEIESIVNTPLTVLFPFILLDLMNNVKSFNITYFIDQITPFLQQFITGIGTGVIVALILFKAMKKGYSEKLSPLALIVAALLAYALAENLKGNGVLAVTTLGLIFGNVYIKEKATLREFSGILSNALEVLVFILIGFIVDVPLTKEFFIKSISIFVIYLLVRFFAVQICLKQYGLREKIFMTLVSPKGIAVAAIIFAFATFQGFERMLDFTLAIMVYTLLVSTIVVRFSDYFLHEKIQPVKNES
ncbi:MAG: cation:proton antiporter [Candidatus Woesearchaeota archaeon]|nr:cation:proton antiporter [Candidatus Woesearchaeota archaeon]